MDSRKNDTERAINLLKLYKSQLNKPEEKSLRKAMDKLIESIDSSLFGALLDIQEFYEHSLTTGPNSNQNFYTPSVNVQPVESKPERPPVEEKPKREKSKKKKHHSEDEPKDNVDYNNDPYYQNINVDVVQQQESDPAFQNPEEQDPWEFYEIELKKSRTGYGFGIGGGYDKPQYEGDVGIFVTKIIDGGSAEVDGRLRIDDVLVEVNGINLDNVTHAEAVNTLKNCGNQMHLVIRRLRDDYYANQEVINTQYEEPEASGYTPQVETLDQTRQEHHEDQPVEHEDENQGVMADYDYESFEMVLIKRQNASLGFSIQGGYDPENPEEDSYISVSKLTPGGLAETDQRLLVGDIILMVDDQSLNGLTHNEAVNLLKATGRQVKLYVGRYILKEVIPEQVVVEKSEKKKKKKHKRDRERHED